MGYISNDTRRLHTYIANRAQQVREFSYPDQRHHISDKLNPADLASRGASVDELIPATHGSYAHKFCGIKLWIQIF